MCRIIYAGNRESRWSHADRKRINAGSRAGGSPDVARRRREVRLRTGAGSGRSERRRPCDGAEHAVSPSLQPSGKGPDRIPRGRGGKRSSAKVLPSDTQRQPATRASPQTMGSVVTGDGKAGRDGKPVLRRSSDARYHGTKPLVQDALHPTARRPARKDHGPPGPASAGGNSGPAACGQTTDPPDR